MLLKRYTKNMIAMASPSKKGVSVLMYHSVDNNNVFFTVSPENFKKQMNRLFKSHYRVIRLDELIDVLEKGEKMPKKTVVLTFDDGYKDNYTNAWPILRKYNFPAIIFLTVDLVGREISNSQNSSLPALNWQEAKEMSNSGLIEFGSHSLTHPKLDKMDILKAEKEIIISKKIIEDKMGKECLYFSSPKGRYTPEIIEVVKESGYRACLGISGGFVKKGDNLYPLKRNSINSTTTLIQFKSKI